MAHLHSVYDTDMHFSIDPITRKIKNEASRKTTVMQFDHGSERLTFELPRYIEGHDMLSCNLVEIHYNNIGAKTKEENRDFHKVDDLQVSPASDDVVVFSWMIQRQATQLAGALAFCIRFACVTDEVDYEWHTDTFTGISVSSSLRNGEYIAEQYADILEQWRQHIDGKLEDIQDVLEQWRQQIEDKLEDVQNVRSYYDAETQTLYITGSISDDSNDGDNDSGNDVPEVCTHENTKIEYISKEDAYVGYRGSHTKKTVCTTCGEVLGESSGGCFPDASKVAYTDNGDGTHTNTYVCRECGQISHHIYDHIPSDNNASICDYCGATIGG